MKTPLAPNALRRALGFYPVLAMLGTVLLTPATAMAQKSAPSPKTKEVRPVAIDWVSALEKHSPEIGRDLAFTCPAAGAPLPGTVWGTRIYTSDSSICAAAVHAGRMTPEEGGTVVVRVLAGRDFYHGSAAHAVTSQDYGDGWEMSFAFLDRSGAAYEGDVTTLGWAATAEILRPRAGESLTLHCPPGGEPAGVWGTEIYTDDSSICTAAVHAGKITLGEGGLVTLRIRHGRDAYQGSQRNGVRSEDNGRWKGSFSFN